MGGLRTLAGAALGVIAAGCVTLSPEDAERKRVYEAAVQPCKR